MMHYVKGCRVIVNLSGGMAVEGKLIHTKEELVLIDAQSLPGGQKIDGRVIIPRSNVAWVQVP